MSTWRPLRRPVPEVPGRITASVDQLAKGLGAPGAAALRTVFARWAEVVGPDLARHSRPLRLTRGTLVVGVGEPGLATEIRYRAAEILERAAALAGGPVGERLEVRVRARR